MPLLLLTMQQAVNQVIISELEQPIKDRNLAKTHLASQLNALWLICHQIPRPLSWPAAGENRGFWPDGYKLLPPS